MAPVSEAKHSSWKEQFHGWNCSIVLILPFEMGK